MEFRNTHDKSRHNEQLAHKSMYDDDQQKRYKNAVLMENIRVVNENKNHEEKMKQKYRQKLSVEANRRAGEKGMSAIEYFRAQCLARGVSGIRGIGRLFRIMDDDGSKMLNFDELKTGLQDYGIDLKPAQVQEIFDAIDVDNQGSISFDEFIMALRPPMSNSRLNMIERAFNKMNRNNDKCITIEDLQDTYDVTHHPKFQNGEWTKKQCLLQFLSQFEPDKTQKSDGKITYDEFVNYYSGVSASIDDDAYFNLMMTNAFKLND